MSVSISTVEFEGRYTLPVVENIADSPEEIAKSRDRVRVLARERNAVILGAQLSARRNPALPVSTKSLSSGWAECCLQKHRP